MTKLETEFTAALLRCLRAAEDVTGVAETRLAAKAEADGGAEAVRKLLAHGSVTRQFGPLKEAGRLDLSVESLVIQGRYAALFTDDEVNLCLSTLLDAGAF